MRRRTAARAAVALLAFATLLPAPSAQADHLEQRKRRVDRQLAVQEDDLDEASAAVRKAAADLRRVRVALPAAERALAAAEGELAAARRRATAAQAAVAAAAAAVRATEQGHAAAQQELARSRAQLSGAARTAYIAGPVTALAIVMQARTPGEFFERQATWRAVLGTADAHVVAAANARARIASQRSLLRHRQTAVTASEHVASAALARVARVAAAAASARAEVARHVAARATALAVAERERADDLRRYQALQAESRRLGQLIRAAVRSTGDGRIGRTGMAWPTQGVITSRYGWRVHPIYGYRRFHAGVDIGAPTGRPIVAALAGVVVTAGRLGTYGNLVVIDHGNGFATAYAHQSRLLVRVGQRVARGQRIGLVGSTGASTGPHLHFETRVNGEPVDPMRYY